MTDAFAVEEISLHDSGSFVRANFMLLTRDSTTKVVEISAVVSKGGKAKRASK
ncbi:hypothetical protein D3C71_2170830 [compost metagenome]